MAFDPKDKEAHAKMKCHLKHLRKKKRKNDR